jgi:hypothetical protein
MDPSVKEVVKLSRVTVVGVNTMRFPIISSAITTIVSLNAVVNDKSNSVHMNNLCATTLLN